MEQTSENTFKKVDDKRLKKLSTTCFIDSKIYVLVLPKSGERAS